MSAPHAVAYLRPVESRTRAALCCCGNTVFRCPAVEARTAFDRSLAILGPFEYRYCLAVSSFGVPRRSLAPHRIGSPLSWYFPSIALLSPVHLRGISHDRTLGPDRGDDPSPAGSTWNLARSSIIKVFLVHDKYFLTYYSHRH